MADADVRKLRWLDRIQELGEILPRAHRSLAITKEAGRRNYMAAWEAMYAGGETSLTVIDKKAKQASLDFDLLAIKDEGEIRGLESELDILKFLIIHM